MVKGKKKSRQQKKVDSKAKERDRLVKLTFVKYGSKSVLREYRAMSLEIAKVLIEALYGMITQWRVMLMLDNAQLPQVQLSGSHSAPFDINCPLYLLLHHGCDPNINIDMRIYEAIKDKIKTWGAQNALLFNRYFLAMREMQVETNFQDLIAGSRDHMHEVKHSNTLATKTNGSTTFDWKSLAPITIDHLKLFESCKGSVLRGSIVGLPIVCTGITTLFQDEGGNIIQLGIYNYIPGKMTMRRATEYARKHLPKGIRVEIAEPFTKIFVDGNRGVRIDDCREFRVEGEGSGSLSAARLEGNDFFKQKMFLAASEAYIAGLSSEILVPTLLSNRAQAFINLGDWGSALADAASSLTIRPSCEKTRLRYRKALGKLEQENQSHESTSSFPLQEALLKTDFPVLSSKTSNPETADELKAKGNAAFVRKEYDSAIHLYTRSLFESGGDARAVLSNWSQASIELECYHEAVAASAASLRIWLDDKAIFRLCKSLAYLNEYCLAGDLLKHHGCGSNSSLKGLEKEMTNLKTHKPMFPAEDYIRGTRKPDICPDYASDRIETFLDSRKGRGIRATDDLCFGQMIMLQSPLVSAGSDTKKDRSCTFSFDKNRMINDTSQTLIHSEVMHRLNRDQLLARRMSVLSDGKGHPPLVPLSDLLSSISVEDAPVLLPPHTVHYESKFPSLSTEKVRAIIDTNAFASFGEGDTKRALSTGSTDHVTKKVTMVYSAISMFNHSNKPNCAIINYSGSSRMVLTRRAVKRGEELTISYHSDPTVLKSKWGIEN